MNFAKRTIKSPYHFALKTHLPDELSNHWHYALPWTYYLLDGGQRQHAVYEGRQISNLTPYNCGNAHEVFWVASEYLIHGAGDVPFLSLLPNGDKRYRIQDNLGSTRVVLTADGSLYDWNDYEPFGTVLNSSGGQQVSDRLSYIGKEKDAESDLGDFGVRKYESETGRFLSVDPLWEEQRPWNVYHYSANNPIVAKDPDGKLPFFVAVVLTFVGEFFSQTQVANSPRNSYEAKHGKEMGERMIQQAADATAVASTPILLKGGAKQLLKEGAEGLGERVSKTSSRTKNVAEAKGIPKTQLGPSGKPKIHNVSKSNFKKAEDAARNNPKSNSKPEKHSSDKGQKQHFHATKNGQKLTGKDNIHYVNRASKTNSK